MTRNILVLRAGALGDTILTLPALHALRDRYPHARLLAAGYPANWEVAGALADSVVSIDSSTFTTLYADAPTNELRAFLHDVDLVIAWTARDPRPALQGAGVRQVVHASPYPPPGVHAADWLLQSLSRRDLFSFDHHAFRLELDNEEIDGARAMLGTLGLPFPVMLHPGAGAAWKRWPAGRFAHLANALVDRGYPVVLIEGPADRDAVAMVQESLAHPLPILCDLPLRMLAATLSQARLFVGNDSGVTHLAGAVGIPTLALFGPTDPASWAPLGKTKVLRVCQVTPTHGGQIRVCDDPDCMAALRLDDVARELGAFSEADG